MLPLLAIEPPPPATLPEVDSALKLDTYRENNKEITSHLSTNTSCMSNCCS